jgi:hypothetical protein
MPRCAGRRARPSPAADHALAGAVTAALCGSWDHDGPCHFPHHTSTRADGDELVVTVGFDAPDDEVHEVRRLIVAAVRTGTLVGPNGVTNRWHAVD